VDQDELDEATYRAHAAFRRAQERHHLQDGLEVVAGGQAPRACLSDPDRHDPGRCAGTAGCWGGAAADQKPDLDRQVARLAAFAAEWRLRVAKVVAEVGSGLNGKMGVVIP
jgi:hypothetical protein